MASNPGLLGKILPELLLRLVHLEPLYRLPILIIKLVLFSPCAYSTGLLLSLPVIYVLYEFLEGGFIALFLLGKGHRCRCEAVGSLTTRYGSAVQGWVLS